MPWPPAPENAAQRDGAGPVRRFGAPDRRGPTGLGGWREALDGAGAAWGDVLLAHLQSTRRMEADPAWITRSTPDALQARLQALEAERLSCVAAGVPVRRRLPLFGIPFAVKDNIDAAGWVTTAACPAWARVAARDAVVVQRLVAAGAVLVGKTNLDQFATGLVGTRTPYGTPSCTWDATRVSGGSSSGSAVVVARGDVAFALGTDTAGSGRIPAGFNHIVGVKPTPGRVATTGVLPACRTIDCVSIFALDVADGAEVLAAIEGADEADAYSRSAPGPAAWARPPGRRWRVGVPRIPKLDPAVGYDAAWEQALSRLADVDAEAVPLDFEPLHRVGAMLYEGPWVVERLHAVRELLEREPQALDPVVRQIVEAGRRYTALDTFAAQYALRDAAIAAERVWERVDLLVVPTAPTHPTLDALRERPIQANAELGHYTNFVNLLGWCALALPAGVTAVGLPFGVTAIAPAMHDAALLAWGLRWQEGIAPVRSGPTGTGVAGPSAAWPQVEPQIVVAVVGAHLEGQPLNGQLTERGAWLVERTRTSAAYRLHALAGPPPARPGLERTEPGETGAPIEVELWSVPEAAFASFQRGIPHPLGLGRIELEDGRWVTGFVCEPAGLRGAVDITSHGGWRAWRAQVPIEAPPSAP